MPLEYFQWEQDQKFPRLKVFLLHQNFCVISAVIMHSVNFIGFQLRIQTPRFTSKINLFFCIKRTIRSKERELRLRGFLAVWIQHQKEKDTYHIKSFFLYQLMWISHRCQALLSKLDESCHLWSHRKLLWPLLPQPF